MAGRLARDSVFLLLLLLGCLFFSVGFSAGEVPQLDADTKAFLFIDGEFPSFNYANYTQQVRGLNIEQPKTSRSQC